MVWYGMVWTKERTDKISSERRGETADLGTITVSIDSPIDKIMFIFSQVFPKIALTICQDNRYN